MTRAARVSLAGLSILAAGLAAIAGAAVVAVLSNGVLTTSAGAWTHEVRLAGRTLTVNVPGLIRLATAPGVAHLLDGGSLETRAGSISFARDGKALVVLCAPCRAQHPELASIPLTLDRVELRAERTGARVDGSLSANHARVGYTATLASDRVRIEWTLPSTEVASLYRSLASIVPEARSARIEGTMQASGVLDLPSARHTVAFRVSGIEVGGLGTEALQFGPFAMSCRQGNDDVRRVTTGEGEMRWVALDKVGAYLPSAVIAAEDQRFREHAGFDAEEITAMLSDAGAARRGASTLTQQLARTLYTGGEKTIARKLRELLYAIEMERTLGKSRILELYLNTVDWGPGLCGARSAARAYFNKTAAALTPIEAAWLAGILRNPHTAHASQFALGAPERERAEWVLQQMRDFPRRDRLRWARASLEFRIRKPQQPA